MSMPDAETHDSRTPDRPDESGSVEVTEAAVQPGVVMAGNAPS